MEACKALGIVSTKSNQVNCSKLYLSRWVEVSSSFHSRKSFVIWNVIRVLTVRAVSCSSTGNTDLVSWHDLVRLYPFQWYQVWLCFVRPLDKQIKLCLWLPGFIYTISRYLCFTRQQSHHGKPTSSGKWRILNFLNESLWFESHTPHQKYRTITGIHCKTPIIENIKTQSIFHQRWNKCRSRSKHKLLNLTMLCNCL